MREPVLIPKGHLTTCSDQEPEEQHVSKALRRQLISLVSSVSMQGIMRSTLVKKKVENHFMVFWIERGDVINRSLYKGLPGRKTESENICEAFLCGISICTPHWGILSNVINFERKCRSPIWFWNPGYFCTCSWTKTAHFAQVKY